MSRLLPSLAACALLITAHPGLAAPATDHCEADVRASGLQPTGRHFGSQPDGTLPATWPRRGVALVGRILDEPAPNPIYRLRVDRCRRQQQQKP